jgi:hypothetical protein
MRLDAVARRCPGGLVFAALGLLLLLPYAFRRPPTALSALDIARVREAQRLQRLVGERVWPVGSREHPVVIVKNDLPLHSLPGFARCVSRPPRAPTGGED